MGSMARTSKGTDPPNKGRRRHGATARSSDMGSGDLDTSSTRRRIHEAVTVFPEEVDDWEGHHLVVEWTNEPKGPPYPPYIYDGVPPAVWTEFREAGSAGQYVNYSLNTYPYRPAPEELGQV